MKRLLLGTLLCTALAIAQSGAQKESPAHHQATGTFDVEMAPLKPYIQDDSTLGRMSAEKQYHGYLEATSKGEMLSAGKPPTGGYVAIEKVTGKLNGRSGTFVLQHSGTMDQGNANLSIVVVPGWAPEVLRALLAGWISLTRMGSIHTSSITPFHKGSRKTQSARVALVAVRSQHHCFV